MAVESGDAYQVEAGPLTVFAAIENASQEKRLFSISNKIVHCEKYFK